MSRVVSDNNGVHYELTRSLGVGGQGEVFAVAGRDCAVKISNARSYKDELRADENISRVKHLDLKGLNIAKPLSRLAKPNIGYVMKLMTDMAPLQSILRPPRKKNKIRWYQETGGLRRRLKIAGKVAALLTELHSRGLLFGDLSPNNIFISEDPSCEEVWFIDADNITHGTARDFFYTPRYGAPEIVRREQTADSLTDAWSLATVICELLTTAHPFWAGNLVDNEDPEIFGDKADSGELPWIFEAQDTSNQTSQGIPPEIVLSKKLFNLLRVCFEESRRNRDAREGAAILRDQLQQDAQQTIVCPKCKHSYFMNGKICPWCDADRPSFFSIHIFFKYFSEKYSASKHDERWRIVGQEKQPIFVTPDLFGCDDKGKSNLKVSMDRNNIELLGEKDCRLCIFEEGRENTEKGLATKRYSIPISKVSKYEIGLLGRGNPKLTLKINVREGG
jgi:eukaryotic-like serine/threonine-protein kinase